MGVMDITVGKAVSWVFGVFFLLGGLGNVLTGRTVLGGLVGVLVGLFLIPNVRGGIEDRYGISFSRWMVVLIAIVGMAVYGAVAPSTSGDFGGAGGDFQPEKKVKNGTVTIDRVQTQAANLYPTRITIANTGEAAFSPQIDYTVFDAQGDKVCSGSPMINPFSTISPGEEVTDEFNPGSCTFDEDGTYTLRVKVLDADYNALDADTKDFTVEYYGRYG